MENADRRIALGAVKRIKGVSSVTALLSGELLITLAPIRHPTREEQVHERLYNAAHLTPYGPAKLVRDPPWRFPDYVRASQIAEALEKARVRFSGLEIPRDAPAEDAPRVPNDWPKRRAP